jgi:hypothetical protein
MSVFVPLVDVLTSSPRVVFRKATNAFSLAFAGPGLNFHEIAVFASHLLAFDISEFSASGPEENTVHTAKICCKTCPGTFARIILSERSPASFITVKSACAHFPWVPIQGPNGEALMSPDELSPSKCKPMKSIMQKIFRLANFPAEAADFIKSFFLLRGSHSQVLSLTSLQRWDRRLCS